MRCEKLRLLAGFDAFGDDAQAVMMHGIVPRQRAPTPGEYRDTVTVLLMF